MSNTDNILISKMSTFISIITFLIIGAVTVGTKLVYLVPLLVHWNSALGSQKPFLYFSKTETKTLASYTGNPENDGVISIHN
jgi:hypothetical protein